MTTGLRETSSNLFICKCSSKAFALGIDPDTLQILALLCLGCGTEYLVLSMDVDDNVIELPLEPTRVLH